MMITSDNYEIWFLDYLEEKLDPVQKEMVRQFLIVNPDLAGGLEGYIPALKAEIHPSFPHKERLKKVLYEDPAMLESTALAALEGDLAEGERNQFERWIENKPDSRKLMNILGSTKLQPDLKIHFPDKNRLKRKSMPLANGIRIAAVAAILMLAFFIFSPSLKKEETSSALTTESKVTVQKNDPVSLPITAGKPSNFPAEKIKTRKMPAAAPGAGRISKHPTAEPLLAETRTFVPIGKMEPKLIAVTSNAPEFADLTLIRRSAPVYYASGDIPLTEFFNIKLQELKAGQPKEVFTREEFKVAGLRLFSYIPGNHLTGKKGKDGRLKSISFNTQILAFSIPVNQ